METYTVVYHQAAGGAGRVGGAGTDGQVPPVVSGVPDVARPKSFPMMKASNAASTPRRGVPSVPVGEPKP